jgi:NTP pyrophosphatase (non-canonical NTP hydrolase)
MTGVSPAETLAGIRVAQSRAWANKVAKGFNTTDVPMEFGLLVEEVGEAFKAWRKGRPDLGGELADIHIFLFGLAEMTGVDLAAETAKKLAVNDSRAYVRLPNGTPVKEEASGA